MAYFRATIEQPFVIDSVLDGDATRPGARHQDAFDVGRTALEDGAIVRGTEFVERADR
jgi:hypothetical protein